MEPATTTVAAATTAAAEAEKTTTTNTTTNTTSTSAAVAGAPEAQAAGAAVVALLMSDSSIERDTSRFDARLVSSICIHVLAPIVAKAQAVLRVRNTAPYLDSLEAEEEVQEHSADADALAMLPDFFMALLRTIITRLPMRWGGGASSGTSGLRVALAFAFFTTDAIIGATRRQSGRG